MLDELAPAQVKSSNPLFNANRLKLGIFCTNTTSALTLVPERFAATWQNCLEVARLADGMGLEAIVPIARWKGYLDGRPAHYTNHVLDTFTYAAGIAQATTYSSIFATSHAPTIHPVVIAKQTSTIDLISNGRFTLNVVGGWNRREFDMFGIDLLEHAERYEYLAEWLAILRRLWTSNDEFDYDSRYFRMQNAISRPQPVQKPAIPVMNAGLSPVGMRFAAEHSDVGLITLFGESTQAWHEQISQYKRLASEFGRTLQVWTNVMVTIRDTQAEADEYLQRYSETHVDIESVDSFLTTLARENNISQGSERYTFMRRNISIGLGLPIVGSPATVAARFRDLSDAGLDGAIMTYVDFADGLGRFKRDVLPLLEQASLRMPYAGTQARGQASSPE